MTGDYRRARVLIAPDKFKGSLTAVDVATHLAAGLRQAAPWAEIVEVPVADGGDGTVDAAVSAGYRRRPVRVRGPLGEPVDTAYAIRDGVVVAELADACGLVRLPGGRPAPLTASSAGLGDVVRAALDAGCRQVILGVGGSASTDGGAGMLQALGVHLRDSRGAELPGGGAALQSLATVELSALHPRLADVQVLLASDVDNPLLGPAGAAAIYGPQKGASPTDIALLEAALARFSERLAGALRVPAGPHGHPAADLPGAGAAGGVGFAAIAVLGARARPGIELLLELVGFPAQLLGADLVITGEGSLDAQTLNGKAPAGVAAAARSAGVPVIAVAGRNLLDADAMATAGIANAYTLHDLEPDQHRSMTDAARLLERVAHRIADDWLSSACPPTGAAPWGG